MLSAMIGLLAETKLHPGCGDVIGAVDLPVARESTTEYPVIVGSSLKGALRDLCERQQMCSVSTLFGEREAAGAVAITDGRLLLLPVRASIGHFRWVTSPYVLERWCRDLRLCELEVQLPGVPTLHAGQALTAVEGTLYLDSYMFECSSDQVVIEGIAGAISPLIAHESVRARLVDSLVLVSDDDFKYLAKFGLPVTARNLLDKETKTSRQLWYEEAIPPDTLLYAMLIARSSERQPLEELRGLISNVKYLQVGGNETVGQGWCIVSWAEGGGQ